MWIAIVLFLVRGQFPHVFNSHNPEIISSLYYAKKKKKMIPKSQKKDEEEKKIKKINKSIKIFN